MASIPIFAVALLSIVLTHASHVYPVDNSDWTHHLHDFPVKVSWISNNNDWITFRMRAKTRGYVAIGFSPNGGMTGADIILGWVGSDGLPQIKDMHATHNGPPVEDPQQNVELLSGSQIDDVTEIIFRRKWDTCDDNDFPLGDDTVRMIWAISDQDPSYFYEDYHTMKLSVAYHGYDVFQRGSLSAFLKAPQTKARYPDEQSVYPKDVFHIDFTMNNITVPFAETYYHCNIHKMEKFDKPHHVVAYRPIISPGMAPYIHHVSIFQCHIPEILGESEESVFAKYLNHPGADCYTDEAPSEWKKYCFEFRIATGIGSKGEIYPDHLGDVMGTTTKPTFLRLEVHYENPAGKYLIDSSGLRVFYTPKLRPYEIAILFAGHRRTPFFSIPPHQKAFTVTGFCSADCTNEGIGPEGIKIISVLLHAHLRGKKIVLRHIRNGKELPIIAQDNAVDFNFQHYRNLEKEVTVLPGDVLITECTFETEGNNTFIYGGLSARREMCESFISYYPKSTLIDCRSQPEFYSYLGAVGIKEAQGEILRKFSLPYDPNKIPEEKRKLAQIDDAVIIEPGNLKEVYSDIFRDVKIERPGHLQNVSIHDFMLTLPWHDQQFSRTVEQKWRLGTHYMHCAAPGGRKIAITKHVVPFPTYKPIMEVTNKPCLLKQSEGFSGFSSASLTHFQYLTSILCSILTLTIANF